MDKKSLSAFVYSLEYDPTPILNKRGRFPFIRPLQRAQNLGRMRRRMNLFLSISWSQMMGVRRGSRSSDNLRRAECGYLRLCGRPRRRSQRQPNAPRANKQIGGRWSRPTPRRPKSLALSSTGSCPKSWFEKKNVEENQNIVNKTGKALKKQVEKKRITILYNPVHKKTVKCCEFSRIRFKEKSHARHTLSS